MAPGSSARVVGEPAARWQGVGFFRSQLPSDRFGLPGKHCAVREDMPPVAPKIRIALDPTEEVDPHWQIGEMTTLLPI